jgi:hypothetical protein
MKRGLSQLEGGAYLLQSARLRAISCPGSVLMRAPLIFHYCCGTWIFKHPQVYGWSCFIPCTAMWIKNTTQHVQYATPLPSSTGLPIILSHVMFKMWQEWRFLFMASASVPFFIFSLCLFVWNYYNISSFKTKWEWGNHVGDCGDCGATRSGRSPIMFRSSFNLQDPWSQHSRQ